VFFALMAICLTVNGSSAVAMVQGQIVDVTDPIGKAIVGIVIQGNGLLNYCSGTLVGSKTVLTAAHCFDGFTSYKTIVTFGIQPFQYGSSATAEAKKIAIKTEDEFFNHFDQMKRAASPVTIHPSYQASDANVSFYDLALIYLLDPAPKTVNPIPIAKMADSLSFNESLKVMSSGLNMFSSDSILPADQLLETQLKASNFNIVSNTSQFVSQSSNQSWNAEMLALVGSTGIGTNLILIEEPSSEKLTKGDSGASAVIFRDQQAYVTGVLSQQYWDTKTLNVFGGAFINLLEPSKNKWLKNNIK
ncbi:MAG: trypsin-like serine protease, partial [Pseudobdellovibrionaceae bacterium]